MASAAFANGGNQCWGGLDAAKIACQQLVLNLAGVEQDLRDRGLNFFSLPMSVGQLIIEHDEKEVFANLFKAENKREPFFVHILSRVRDLKEEIRVSIRRGDEFDAFDNLVIAGELLDAFTAALSEARALLIEFGYPGDGREADYGLPVDPEEQTEEQAQIFAELRAWVMCLPEVQSALEQGFMTEEEAFEMTILNEERFVQEHQGQVSTPPPPPPPSPIGPAQIDEGYESGYERLDHVVLEDSDDSDDSDDDV